MNSSQFGAFIASTPFNKYHNCNIRDMDEQIPFLKRVHEPRTPQNYETFEYQQFISYDSYNK